MLQKVLLASLALGLSLSIAAADTVKGKVKAVDTEKKTITVTVDDKDVTYDTAKDVKITALTKKKKITSENPLSSLSALTTGAEVTVTIEKKDDKDQATSIRQE